MDDLPAAPTTEVILNKEEYEESNGMESDSDSNELVADHYYLLELALEEYRNHCLSCIDTLVEKRMEDRMILPEHLNELRKKLHDELASSHIKISYLCSTKYPLLNGAAISCLYMYRNNTNKILDRLEMQI